MSEIESSNIATGGSRQVAPRFSRDVLQFVPLSVMRNLVITALPVSTFDDEVDFLRSNELLSVPLYVQRSLLIAIANYEILAALPKSSFEDKVLDFFTRMPSDTTIFE
ncbi:hypothetical protein Ocin01_04927, partial [Orchesella cincta]